MRKLVVLVVGLIAAFGAAQALAHHSRTQLACGALAGGANVMTGTLTCPSPGLVFTANGSSLDCRGYSLIAPGVGGSFGIRAASKIGITIRNCNVRGYGTDYALIKLTRSMFTTNTAFKGSTGYLVQSSFTNQFVDNVATGVSRGFWLITSSGNTFQDNAAVANSTAGYDLEKASTKNRFTDNLAINDLKIGFLVGPNGSGNVFSLNRAMSNGNGIIVQPTANGNTFRSNAASGNAGLNCRNGGVGNTWVGNVGGPVSVPPAICP